MSSSKSKTKAKAKAKAKAKRKAAPKRPSGGRPSCIEDEKIRQDILDAVRLGMSYEWAAYSAGICEKTFYNLKTQGEADLSSGKDSIYAKFLQDLKRAESEGMERDLRNIDTAAQAQWQASAWKLERRFPDMFGRNRTVEVQDGERTIKVEWGD